MRWHVSNTATARLTIALAVWGAATCSGCVVGGRTNLAAADAIDVVVESLTKASASSTKNSPSATRRNAAGRWIR